MTILRAVVVALAFSPAIASAKCDLTVGPARTRLTDGTRFDAISPKAFYFLEGVWATSPVTPAGLPPGASRAFLLRKHGADEGDVVFVKGLDDSACIIGPMLPAPKALIDLIGKIDHGPGEAL